MNKVKKLVSVAIIATMGFSLISCDMIEKTPEAKAKEVVAKVKNEKITRGDIDEMMKGTYDAAKQQYGENYAENTQVMDMIKTYKEQALDMLVKESVLLQKGEELGIFNADEIKTEADKRLEEIKTNIEKQGQNYEEQLKVADTTEEKLLESYVKQVKQEKVHEYMVKDVKVEEADVKASYDTNIDQYKKEAGNTISHILVETEDEAKEILKELEGGANFAKLATEKSKDPGSAAKGGELQDNYEADKSQYVEEFNKGIEAIKDGGISPEPVKSDHGYHIIKVDVRSEATTRPYEEVQPIIEKTLLEQKKNEAFNVAYEEWKKELGVDEKKDKL